MNYRCYEAYRNAAGGVESCGAGEEYVEAICARDAAEHLARIWGARSARWDGGDVIVAEDEDGVESYHLYLEEEGGS